MDRSQIETGLYDLSRDYKLNADLLVCRKCHRGIIFSRIDEDMRHASDCLNRELTTNPWKLLKRLTAAIGN